MTGETYQATPALPWTVLLLGGASATGKTVAAAAIARRLGIGWTLVHMAWLYDGWLAAEAARAGLPVVLSRPRDGVVERILQAAGDG